MSRAAAGDRQAFDVLAARYGLRLRRAALRVLGDPAAAEDVAQDALLRAWMRAGTYDRAQASVGTWLHRIAVNAAIDRVRAARPTTEVPESLHDPAYGADLVLAGRQRRRLLAEAIASLPARQRTAIALTYGEGWSGQEAARALSVSTRALEGLLHRGRKLVRAYLEARDA
ncbi:MAG: RNA polymerase sigma factor [Acetobacteraceae bacterium]